MGTDFWTDPNKHIVGVKMIQTLPGYGRLVEVFQVLGYSALID